MTAVGGEPGVRAPVAYPRNKSAVEVYSRAVLRSFSTHDGGIHRDDVLRWQAIVEGDLHRDAPLRNDNATQMLRKLAGSAQWHRGIKTPKSSRPEAGVELVSELADIDTVVGYSRGGSGEWIGR